MSVFLCLAIIVWIFSSTHCIHKYLNLLIFISLYYYAIYLFAYGFYWWWTLKVLPVWCYRYILICILLCTNIHVWHMVMGCIMRFLVSKRPYKDGPIRVSLRGITAIVDHINSSGDGHTMMKSPKIHVSEHKWIKWWMSILQHLT